MGSSIAGQNVCLMGNAQFLHGCRFSCQKWTHSFTGCMKHCKQACTQPKAHANPRHVQQTCPHLDKAIIAARHPVTQQRVTRHTPHWPLMVTTMGCPVHRAFQKVNLIQPPTRRAKKYMTFQRTSFCQLCAYQSTKSSWSALTVKGES